MNQINLEEMSSFFDMRAQTYDDHMIKELSLTEFYVEIEKCLNLMNKPNRLLDLGCGTGLEIERAFQVFPNLEITGIDLSKNMLEKLQEKFPNKKNQLNLICGSYFDIDFKVSTYDVAISTYSLHHFDYKQKLSLYKRVYKSLKNNGMYIEGDYIVGSKKEEEYLLAENKRIRNEMKIKDGFYHYDTPLAIDTQIELLKAAGFNEVVLHKKWDKTIIVICKKL